MKKLVLLDADVIIDLHTLDLFDKIISGYEVYVTKTAFDEAKYYKQNGKTYPIDIKDKVTIIRDTTLDSLMKVQDEAREAMLTIDPGEAEAIACLCDAKKDLLFCTCDQAAIKLISYIQLEDNSISLESALKKVGYTKHVLYPRHLENKFKECLRIGRVLRIQLKKLI
jgi:hypothetical protein